MTEEAASEVYTHFLLGKKQGYPLWRPDPNDFLPAYRARGVGIGDVGMITPDGAFDFLFNICLPRDSPINRSSGSLPHGFKPVPLGPNDSIDDVHMFNPGTDISTKSIKKTQLGLSGTSENNPAVPISIGASFQFNASTSDGAILLLPQGASRTDLLNLRSFRDYAIRNAADWYQFANGPLGREAGNGSLYLTTGCDKASSWGIASFSNESKSRDFSLTFKAAQIADGSASYEYSWENDNSVAARVGPDPPRSNNVKNQCVFLRGYKITLRGSLFASLLGPVKVSPVPGDPSANVSGHFPLRISSQLLQSQKYHPSNIINNYLLDAFPNAQVAITHDDDWRSLVEDVQMKHDDVVVPDNNELLRRVREKYQPTVLHNGVFLTSTHGANAVTVERENGQRA